MSRRRTPATGERGGATVVNGNGELSILPQGPQLTNRRATAQLIATFRGPGGVVNDQTRSVEWVSSNPAVASVTPKGRVVPKGDGTATIVARAGSLEARTTVKVSGDGVAGAGELSPGRDSGVQPGGLQHGRLPRHAHGKGRLPAEPPRLPSRPGLFDSLARSRRPANQPDGARDQSHLAETDGADPPRGRLAAVARLEEL